MHRMRIAQEGGEQARAGGDKSGPRADAARHKH